MLLIIAALALTALYTGGTWLVSLVTFLRNREAFAADDHANWQLETHTFHLGLCFVLAIGFLGLILK